MTKDELDWIFQNFESHKADHARELEALRDANEILVRNNNTLQDLTHYLRKDNAYHLEQRAINLEAIATLQTALAAMRKGMNELNAWYRNQVSEDGTYMIDEDDFDYIENVIHATTKKVVEILEAKK